MNYMENAPGFHEKTKTVADHKILANKTLFNLTERWYMYAD